MIRKDVTANGRIDGVSGHEFTTGRAFFTQGLPEQPVPLPLRWRLCELLACVLRA